MRRTFHQLGILTSLALLVAGCYWPVPGQGPNRQANNPTEDEIGVDTVGSLHQVWSADTDEGAVGDPIASIGGIHVNDSRSVYGFDVATGSRTWAHTVAAPLAATQPWVVGDDLVVSRWNPTATSTTDPEASEMTTRLDPSTGAVRGDVVPGVVVAARDNEVLMSEFSWTLGHPTGQYWLEGLSLRDVDTAVARCCVARLNWHSGEGAVPAMPAWWATEATVGTELVLNAGWGLNDISSLQAVYTLRGNALRGFAISTTATGCPTVQIVVCPTWLVKLDGTTSTAPVLTDDQTVAYAGTDAGTLYAVSYTATGGIVLWSLPLGSAVTDSPALANGSLYVPTAAGDLVVVDAATGAVQWSGSTGSAITQQPAVAGGVVFTGSADGAVTAFDAAGCGAATCSPLWSATTGSPITGAPAVSQGQLYVGTEDGRLVAYGL